MNTYKSQVQSNPSTPNLLAAGSANNVGKRTSNAASGVMDSLSNFFGNVGNIADEFGKQNAQIEGERTAQENHVTFINAQNKKTELETTLKDPKLTVQQRELAQSELLKTDSNIKQYVAATKKHPGINIAEMTRQQTQAQLYKTDLSNQYTQMTEQAYEHFKDDPKGFATATQKLTKQILKDVPTDIVGSSMEAFKNVNSQVASKVHQNFIVKQKDILVNKTNTTINDALNMGSKFAYNGGDYSTQRANIEQSYSMLYKHDLISKEEYGHRMALVDKEFKKDSLTGNFDRIIGYSADQKFLPHPIQIKAGYQEIEKFSNILNRKKGESLDEYQLRTANLNQHDVDSLVKSMRSKLVKGEAAIKSAQTASLKSYTTKTKTAYKMMMKGIKPANYEEIKKLAYVNGQSDEFNSFDAAMTKIQTINDLPLDEQVAYSSELSKQKKTGMTEFDYGIDKTVQSTIKKNVATTKKDPSQAAEDSGMFTNLATMKPDQQGQELIKRKNMVESGEFFAKFNRDPESIITDSEAQTYSHYFDTNPSKILPVVQNLESSLGSKYVKPMLSKMFNKQATAVVYAADRFKTDPTSANMIIAGVEYQKNGGKLDTDDATTWKSNSPEFESTLMTLGKSADAIRKSAYAYYMMMPHKDVKQAYAAVTNGIDGGIIVNKPGQSYDDTYSEITALTERFDTGHKVSFKQKLNGKPTIGYDKVAEMINDDDVQLRSYGQGKYAFITKDTGSVITNTDNKPLVINLNPEEE